MLLLTQLSLLMLANLALVAVGLSATAKIQAGPSKKLLYSVLWSYFLFNLTMFLNTAYYEPGSALFYYLEYPAVLLLSYFMFEFSASVAGGKVEGWCRMFRWLGLPLSLGWLGMLFHVVKLDVPLYGTEFTLLLTLPIALILITLFCLTWWLHRHTEISLWRPFSLIKAGNGLRGRAGAVFGLFSTMVLVVIGAVCLLIMRSTFIQREIFLSLFFALNTIIISGIVFTYLRHIEKRLDLANRITSSLLLLFLVITAFTSVWLFGETDHSNPDPVNALQGKSLSFQMKGSSLYETSLSSTNWQPAEGLKLDLSDNETVELFLPFSFPFYDNRYDRLTVSQHGFLTFTEAPGHPSRTGTPGLQETVCFTGKPAVIPFCSGGLKYDVFTLISSHELRVTWRQKADESTSEGQRIAQLSLNDTGNITFNYHQVPLQSAAIWNTVVGITNGNELKNNGASFDQLPLLFSARAIWFDITLQQRLKMHETYKPFVFFVILVVLFTLFPFKAFLTHTIVGPVHQIRDALHAVNEGRLDLPLNLDRQDEFGDLAHGVADMKDGLKKARKIADEATELLEAELAYHAAAVNSDPVSDSQDFKQRLYSVITERMSEFDFQIADLADDMAMSTRQLHRKTVSLMAQTPSAIIRTMRLTKARDLLHTGSMNVSQAAYKTGFRDVGYFSKLYQKQYGNLPSEIVKAAKQSGSGKKDE